MLTEPPEVAGIDVEAHDASGLVEEPPAITRPIPRPAPVITTTLWVKIQDHARSWKNVVLSWAVESPPTQTSKVEASSTKSRTPAFQ